MMRSNDIRVATGSYKKHLNGYYTFELANKEIIVFEQIDKSIIRDFELKTDKYVDMLFEITFSEIFDDFDSDDFLIFRLEKLELLS